MADELIPATIAVFARPPVAGRVKTRLAATLGEAGALSVYRRLLQLTLATVQATGLPWTLFSAGHSEELMALAASAGGQYSLQQGDELGERMIRALLLLHRTARQVILIGSDCPALSVAHLQQAMVLLRDQEVVLGPAEDGGFWLIGSSAPSRWQDSALFAGVPYGGPEALARTLERLQPHGTISTMLPLLWDLDTEAEYHRAVRESLL